MPCQRRTTANLQARPHLTPARSFRDDIVVVVGGGAAGLELATGSGHYRP
jgi:NADPH-dependent 2,4-dienoyl-CoA reductase/sulfur reductase-like enzyme